MPESEDKPAGSMECLAGTVGNFSAVPLDSVSMNVRSVERVRRSTGGRNKFSNPQVPYVAAHKKRSQSNETLAIDNSIPTGRIYRLVPPPATK